MANGVLNMTRQEVIARLRELINSPTLEQQLERVRENEFIIRYYYRSLHRLRKKFFLLDA